jgi:hypothetical protein
VWPGFRDVRIGPSSEVLMNCVMNNRISQNMRIFLTNLTTISFPIILLRGLLVIKLPLHPGKRIIYIYIYIYVYL